MLATGDIIGEGVGVGPCVIATFILTTADDGSIGTNKTNLHHVRKVLNNHLTCAHTKCYPHNVYHSNTMICGPLNNWYVIAYDSR